MVQIETMPNNCVFFLGYGESYLDGPKHRLQVKGTPVCQWLKDLSLYGGPTAVYGLQGKICELLYVSVEGVFWHNLMLISQGISEHEHNGSKHQGRAGTTRYVPNDRTHR